MTYSRKYLERIRANQKECKPIIEDLLQKFHDGKKLTLAEEEFTCGIMSILRDDTGKYKFDITKLGGCNNYRFRGTYLEYAHDLNGSGNIRNLYGLVGAQQKNEDTAFLNSESAKWEATMKGKKSGDPLLGYIIDETLHQLKMVDKHCAKNGLPDDRKKYLNKSVILHSRFIYLLVSEYHEELGADEIVLTLYGNKILIDQFCFVHTLFRHYAADVKDYQYDKSYHFDPSIPYRDLPSLLIKFIKIFGKNCCAKEFHGRCIDLRFKGKKYSLWFRPFTIHKSGAPIGYLRLETFFPIEAKRDRLRVQGLKKIRINRNLTLLAQHS